MKNTNKFYLECSCSSHTVLFEQFIDDGGVNISYKVDAFSFKQDGFWKQAWNRISLMWSIFIGQEALLYDVCFPDNDTLTAFKEFVANMKEAKGEKNAEDRTDLR
jgi:hypothetical protein